MNAFRDIQNRHTKFLELQPNTNTSDIRTFIDEIVNASKKISSFRERDQLRAILRYWLNYVYEKDGDYLSVELAPSPRRITVKPAVIFALLLTMAVTSTIILIYPSLLQQYGRIISYLPKTPTPSPIPETGQIFIKIKDLDPKAETAVARVVETNETDSLDQGELRLRACANGHTISVWAPGYYIKTFPCNGSIPGYYEISMERIDPTDNRNYPWVSADTRLNSVLGCARCHSDSSVFNEFPEWNKDEHSRAFVNPLFWTTYLGTNIKRMPGQKTLWGFSSDGSRVRLPPDPNQPNYGPGYQLDYPGASGNCAFCHAPAAIGATYQDVNLAPLINSSWGARVNVATEGVTCDVCHKAIDVALDDQGLPYGDRPGILSFSFLRPMPGAQFIAGPWSHPETSNAHSRRTCAPIFNQSEFCAPCHYAKFSEVEVYASYKEWLNSPYSKPDEGFRSCQDCHMPSTQAVEGTGPAARRACSSENTSFRNFSHNMMNRENTGNPILLQGAAQVTVEATRGIGEIRVKAAVVNTRAGHKLPTDSPLRHLILVVEARDDNNRLLTQLEGPIIPDWGGNGNQPEDYAGRPGMIYGNILKDKDTNIVPAVAYWNPTMPAWEGSDTRLRPNEYVTSQYSFIAPSRGAVTITARLIYRYAFIEIMRQKGLRLDDILVNWAEANVP
jgi:nitrate/TMAO reductase-like tetraheme cytochrome c subunit